MKKFFYTVVLSLCGLALHAQQNLITNGGFGDCDEGGQSCSYFTTIKPWEVVLTPGSSGEFISNPVGSYGSSAYEGLARNFKEGDLIHQTVENITPNTDYQFSVRCKLWGSHVNITIEWLKADGTSIQKDALLNSKTKVEEIKATVDPDFEEIYYYTYKQNVLSPAEAAKAKIEIVGGESIDNETDRFFLDDLSFVKAETIDAPTEFKPTDVTSTNIALSWNAVSGVSQYTVTTYTLDEWETASVHKTETVSSTTHTIADLTPKTRYRISVKAVATDGKTPKEATINEVYTIADNSETIAEGTNVFPEGDFSNGQADYRRYWKRLTSGGTAEVVNTALNDGTDADNYKLKITGVAAAPNTRNFFVEPNTKYTIYADIHTNTPRTRLPINIVWYDKVGQRISTSSVANTEAGLTGWETVGTIITSPENAVMATFAFVMDTDISVYTGADIVYVDNVTVLKGELSQPTGFRVYNNTLTQRDVILNWFAPGTQAAQVEINGETYTISEGNKLALHNLTPNTQYTAQLSINGGTKTPYIFTTKAITRKDNEVKIPYLDNLQDGVITDKFFYVIHDLEGGAITKAEFTFNGKTVTADADGYITLDPALEGTLQVTITQQNGDVTVLTYNQVRKQAK